MSGEDAYKRYSWLQLKNTYFNQLEQKKMRRQEHGKEMQIIYLRMMLLSIDKGGYIYYQGVYESLEEELAEEFDESLELVQETIQFLVRNNMIDINDDKVSYYIPEAKACLGSECSSAERVRKHRQKKKEMLQSNSNVTNCNVDIEGDIEGDIERDIEKNSINYQLIADMYNDTCVSFPKLTKLSEKRKKAIKARFKIYSVEDFKRLFELAEESDFLKGKNQRNWSATFDWLITDANMAKVLDGNYANCSSQPKPVQTRFHNFEQHEYKKGELDKLFANN